MLSFKTIESIFCVVRIGHQLKSKGDISIVSVTYSLEQMVPKKLFFVKWFIQEIVFFGLIKTKKVQNNKKI